MFLKKLSVEFFKNIRHSELSFSNRFVCLAGENGAGKTNLLDAIHYLSTGKSYFNYIDSQNIQYEQQYFTVRGTFTREEQEDEVMVGYMQRRKKVLKKNEVQVPRLMEHYGQFPVVMVTPYDIALILGGSEDRRNFLDSIISLDDHDFMEKLSRYDKVLQQRNAQLKAAEEHAQLNRDLMAVYNEKLAHLGTVIFEKRQAFVKDFAPVFHDLFRVISDDKEQVDLQYVSQLQEAQLKQLLEKNLDRDLILQRTTSGIHKDDLDFTIAGHPLKKFGSQGQQKSFLLALKLAEFRYVQDKKGFPPLLLLDDLFDRLDNLRVAHLIKLLAAMKEGQIFITDTSIERIREFIGPLTQHLELFRVENGKVEVVED